MTSLNKIAIAIIVAFIVCINPTLATVFSRKHGAMPSHLPKVASKVADFACNLTDYKELCKDTMTHFSYKASVRDVFKKAFRANKVAVHVARRSVSSFAAKVHDADSTQRLDECKEFLKHVTGDLSQLSRIVGHQIKTDLDLGNLEKQQDILILLSGVLDFQGTCLDECDKPELRAKVEDLLLNSMHLTTNALSIVASTPKILKEFNITAKPK